MVKTFLFLNTSVYITKTDLGGIKNEEKINAVNDDFQDGDVVKVTYTGIVTEVDPFEGEIIKIEKVN